MLRRGWLGEAGKLSRPSRTRTFSEVPVAVMFW